MAQPIHKILLEAFNRILPAATICGRWLPDDEILRHIKTGFFGPAPAQSEIHDELNNVFSITELNRALADFSPAPSTNTTLVHVTKRFEPSVNGRCVIHFYYIDRAGYEAIVLKRSKEEWKKIYMREVNIQLSTMRPKTIDHQDNNTFSELKQMKSNRTKRNPTKRTPVFPTRLYEMLENAEREGYSHLISWMPDGKSFRIHVECSNKLEDESAMIEVLKQTFNQTKFKSFARQLQLYGFQRVRDGTNKGECRHEFLIRGRKDLLLQKSIEEFSAAATERQLRKTKMCLESAAAAAMERNPRTLPRAPTIHNHHLTPKVASMAIDTSQRIHPRAPTVQSTAIKANQHIVTKAPTSTFQPSLVLAQSGKTLHATTGAGKNDKEAKIAERKVYAMKSLVEHVTRLGGHGGMVEKYTCHVTIRPSDGRPDVTFIDEDGNRFRSMKKVAVFLNLLKDKPLTTTPAETSPGTRTPSETSESVVTTSSEPVLFDSLKRKYSTETSNTVSESKRIKSEDESSLSDTSNCDSSQSSSFESKLTALKSARNTKLVESSPSEIESPVADRSTTSLPPSNGADTTNSHEIPNVPTMIEEVIVVDEIVI